VRKRTWAAIGVVALAAGGGGVTGAVLTVAGSASAHASDAPATVQSSVIGTAAPQPLVVTAVAHATATTDAVLLGAVTVQFSRAVDPALVHPTLVPALAGTWSQPSPTTLAFTPAAVPLPGQQLTLTVPAGDGLAAAYTQTWQTRDADPARLQQLLAEDGYLPLSFTPTTAEPTTASALAASAFAATTGSYAWRFLPPAPLQALYTGAQSTLLTRGALLAFQADHQLATDGVAGPQVWTALAAALADGQKSSDPYTSVYVTKSLPETLTLYRDGAKVLSTPANTGVRGAETPDGSWAVYARFASQTMSGTNPDGSHYSDPGVPWISYFVGGDAVHGFPRATYGSPQSVGCVELPIATAQQVYGLMGYGDIVTVAG